MVLNLQGFAPASLAFTPHNGLDPTMHTPDPANSDLRKLPALTQPLKHAGKKRRVVKAIWDGKSCAKVCRPHRKLTTPFQYFQSNMYSAEVRVARLSWSSHHTEGQKCYPSFRQEDVQGLPERNHAGRS
jgi:hypothetical protein